MNVNKNKIVKHKQFYRRKKEFSSEKRRNPSTKPNGIKILWFAYNLICNCIQMHCKLWTRMNYASNVWHIKFSTQSLSIYFPNTWWKERYKAEPLNAIFSLLLIEINVFIAYAFHVYNTQYTLWTWVFYVPYSHRYQVSFFLSFDFYFQSSKSERGNWNAHAFLSF